MYTWGGMGGIRMKIIIVMMMMTIMVVMTT